MVINVDVIEWRHTILTMSSSKGPGKSHSAFDAFAKVDELVSKPVLGSDGAASYVP